MKEWNKPQLLSLGVENTFGDKGHWCHDLNNGKGAVCTLKHTGNNYDGHTQADSNHHHTPQSLGLTDWEGNGQWVKCCCGDS